MARLTSTTPTWLPVHAATAVLPVPSSLTAADGGSIAALLSSGRGGSGLIVRLRSPVAEITLTGVRAWLRDAGQWGKLAQAGASDEVFGSVVVPAGLALVFQIAEPGLADRLLIEATVAGGDVVIEVKRFDEL